MQLRKIVIKLSHIWSC